MPSFVTPRKNVAFIFYCGLVSQADTKLLQTNPTLAAGDVIVEIDGVDDGNIATLPVVTPAGGTSVKVSLSSDEMNGDNIVVKFKDVAGAEWCDLTIAIQTTARQIDDLGFPVVSGRGFDVTATGAVGIDWANVENPTTALNLSGTNIDVDQIIASISGNVDGNVTGNVTGNVGGNVTGSIGSLATQAKADVNAEVVDVIRTDVIPDSVAADGSRPTVAQALLMLTRFLNERSVTGVTMTVFKEDGSTGSMTFTLNDATNPTGITRAS